MLLNEFLKEHYRNQQQEAMIARLEKQIDALVEGLQKVNAELGSAKRGDRVALNRYLWKNHQPALKLVATSPCLATAPATLVAVCSAASRTWFPCPARSAVA